MVAKRIAVLFATKGGMGDVGKFAAVHAMNDPSCQPVVIAVSQHSVEGDDKGVDVEVTDAAAASNLRGSLGSMEVRKVDIEDAAAQAQLEEALEGVDAVVACLGNRQPSMARWSGLGAEKLSAAMSKRRVRRLVSLSSTGLANDYLPFRGMWILWPLLMRTAFRSACLDLRRHEAAVAGSDLDYVLVRPTGLTPSEPPRGSWHLLRKYTGEDLAISVAKSDVATFMLKEECKTR